jgi:hypothetical protein
MTDARRIAVVSSAFVARLAGLVAELGFVARKAKLLEAVADRPK